MAEDGTEVVLRISGESVTIWVPESASNADTRRLVMVISEAMADLVRALNTEEPSLEAHRLAKRLGGRQ